MTPLILDTHEAIHELVSAGMPERQAETVVRQQARLLEQNLATKADIEALQQATKADIETTKADLEKLRQETKALIETAKVDLIKWIVGINVGTVSLIVAMIKLL